MDKLGFIQVKNDCDSENTVKKAKNQQPKNERKYLEIMLSDKGRVDYIRILILHS